MMLMANKYYIMLFSLIMIISVASCTSRVDDADTQSSDLHLETPGTAPETDWQLPDNYVTHTDSTGLFSVSFPPSWEENSNPIGVDLQAMETIIEKVNAGDLVDQAGAVFFWGVPTATGYHPSCNLFIEPRPESLRTVQRVMEEQIAGMKSFSQEFEEIKLDELINDGRESAILEYQAIINGVDVHSLVLVTIVDDTIWTNGCLVRQESADYSDYEIVFWNVVRSLEVHK